MGARQRLNSLYLAAILVFSAIIGRANESWWVFLVIAGTLIALAAHAGGIRTAPRRRPRKRRRSPRRPYGR